VLAKVSIVRFGVLTTQIIVALLVLVVAVLVARRLENRRPEPPTRDRYPVPAQLDRSDFPRPEAPWLVVLFSSLTCESCVAMAAKVAVLTSASVATCEVEYSAQPELHRRYGIEGVPLVVVADAEGVTRAAFVGTASAAELWAAVAQARGSELAGPGTGV
jgi:protein-disulfide isomerase